jgi:Kef-type K+ transport system membrane component KefB
MLACAGADDILGWALLAVALAALGAGSEPGVAGVLLETAGFAVAMTALAQPMLLRPFARWFARARTLTPGVLAAVIAAILISAWVTDAIGVSFVFGAFLLGVVFPREQAPQLVAAVEAKVGALVMVLLLPIFFVLPGLSVDLRGLESGGLGDFALILLVACAGKLLGSGGSARLLGFGWREASAIGVLMNTRGAMELVVLNVGLAAGVLDSDLYSLFVLMAVATTMMTAPLLRRIYPADAVERDLAQAPELPPPTTMAT